MALDAHATITMSKLEKNPITGTVLVENSHNLSHLRAVLGLPKLWDLLPRAEHVAAFEIRLMQTAMQRASGNLSQAARLLGITRPQLAYRLKKEGVSA